MIAAGGSGGHIFPAVALAQRLTVDNADIEILFVISKSQIDMKLIEKKGFNIEILNIDTIFSKRILKNLISFVKLILGFFKSIVIILNFEPDLVVGFGGYVSFPILIAASLLRRKTLIHEQNIKPGRSNGFLSEFVDKIAISFEKTGKYLRRKNYILTGNPLREELLKIDRQSALKRLQIPNQRFKILVLGGSQGSHSINLLILDAMNDLGSDLKDKIHLIHLTGKADFEFVRKNYDKFNINANVYPFLDSIEDAYAVSDLVVSRSGATTCSELTNFKLPAILIPYPYAGKHQSLNANLFKEVGCCIVREENELNKDELKNLLVELFENRELLKKMSDCYDKLTIKDSANNLKNLAISCIERD